MSVMSELANEMEELRTDCGYDEWLQSLDAEQRARWEDGQAQDSGREAGGREIRGTSSPTPHSRRRRGEDGRNAEDKAGRRGRVHVASRSCP